MEWVVGKSVLLSGQLVSGVNVAEGIVEPWRAERASILRSGQWSSCVHGKKRGVGHFSEWALLARIGGVNVSEALVIHWTSMSDAGIKSKTLALKDKYWSI